MKNGTILFLGVLALLFGASQCLYSVFQSQNALVLQLGRPVGSPQGPGLHFKLPLIQNVIYFDTRVLEYNAKSAEVLTSDKKTIVVDNYAKWKIIDPLMFYQTVKTVPQAQMRLDEIIYAQVRVALGQYTLTEIVSVKRPEIMAQVTRESSDLVHEYGIEVVDVRIKRTDLPAENERAIYGRMRAERERQAKQYRSEGQEEAAKIKSSADRDRTVLLADAQKQADATRGEGDAEATRIYAEALNQAPEFYVFKRSLDAYVTSFKDKTRVILTPDNRFLELMR